MLVGGTTRVRAAGKTRVRARVRTIYERRSGARVRARKIVNICQGSTSATLYEG